MRFDIRIPVTYDDATVADAEKLEQALRAEIMRFIGDGGLTPLKEEIVDEYDLYIRTPMRGPFGKDKMALAVDTAEADLTTAPKTFNIWSEGYRATGGASGATFHGIGGGVSFKDACKRFFAKDPKHSGYYDEKTNTYWGCGLFDDESAARRSFG